MWHASIAAHNKRGVIDSADLTGAQMVFMAELGKSLLNGVGTGQDYELWKGPCFHFRRQLSDSELQLLSAEWLAIPAVDMA